MPRLSEAERNQVLGMLEAGIASNAIARRFGCSRKTIQRLVTRYQQTGTVRDRPRPGHPRVTTARTDRYITLTHLRQRRLPATVTARRYGVSAQTIRNRLRSNAQPIRARRPYFGQVMTRRHRHARLLWSRRHLNWRRADWNRVLFTDESRFCLSHADGRIRNYRRKNERYADCCVI